METTHKGANQPKTTKIADLTFASGAEAVAHFLDLGFSDFYIGEAGEPRIMRNATNEEVMITHEGFLTWNASHIRLC